MKTRRNIVLLSFTFLAVAGCGVLFDLPTTSETQLADVATRWNKLAVDASGLDHTPAGTGAPHEFGHQLGPTRASRAMAIVHIAMFDAANAIEGGYQSYTRIDSAKSRADVRAAIACAAHDTLKALYPSQADIFDAALTEDLDAIADSTTKSSGLAVGQAAAAAILDMREFDGSEVTQEYVFSDEPGAWRADPINPNQSPLGEEWFRVKPFVLNSATQFRCPEPPSLDSAEYAAAYNEVKAIGGDGIVTPTIRTADETEIGLFWAYDGTPSLCAPPRLYNQIAAQIAIEQGVTGMELLRLMTLVNVSMADACIAVWESKYYYNYWRPVTGIREADEGTGPSGLGDGNADTSADPTYVPLCAPASNLAGKNFTPPFPSYPSGHAGFGGALFETLRGFFGTDDISFTFVSDEFNGVTTDNEGNVRPLIPRSFSRLSQAEEENGQSRIYLGIHWSFDKTAGIEQGNQVADHVMNHAFLPTN